MTTTAPSASMVSTRQPPHASPAPAAGHRAAAWLAALALLALQACGGGGATSDVQPQPKLQLPSASGKVEDGANAVDFGLLAVQVKGTAGTARTASGRPGPVDGSDYLASLDQLTGPYLVEASSNSILLSVAIAPGTVNLTPFTTLLVAQVVAADPYAYFVPVGAAQQSNGLTVDAAGLRVADQRVRRYLKREFGFDVPASVGDFVTTPFDRVAGNAMYDAIVALTKKLGNGGDYRALAKAVGEEAARCKVESVTVASAGVIDPFCPISKSNQFDFDDSTLEVLSFTNKRGDALTVRTRGSSVVSVQLLTAEQASFACSAAACAGIVLGTPAGDQTRPLTFAQTVLTGTTGNAQLDGSLSTAVPGVALPGLACTANRYYLIRPDNTAIGYCAGPDDFGLGQGGSASPYGLTRLNYLFQPVTVDPTYTVLRVIVDGDTVRSVAAINTDGVSPSYVCVGAGCSGAALGAVRIDNSLGSELQLRSVDFADVVLQAVQPNGSLSTSDTLTLRAQLVGAYAPQPPLSLDPCADPAQSLAVQTSDTTAPVTVCVPADPMGNTLTGSDVDGSGQTGFFLQNLLTDGNGSFSTGDSVTVLIAADGSVVSVGYVDRYGVSYGCSGSTCSGVTVSAPNDAGEHTVTLAATPMTEQGSIAVTADRTATATGSFVAPAPQ